jgi:hypothetical protein
MNPSESREGPKTEKESTNMALKIATKKINQNIIEKKHYEFYFDGEYKQYSKDMDYRGSHWHEWDTRGMVQFGTLAECEADQSIDQNKLIKLLKEKMQSQYWDGRYHIVEGKFEIRECPKKFKFDKKLKEFQEIKEENSNSKLMVSGSIKLNDGVFRPELPENNYDRLIIINPDENNNQDAQ